jgi:phosphate transport system permease protein
MNKTKINNLLRRHQKEKRFIFFGKLAVFMSVSFLIFLLSTIIFKGYGAFLKTKIALEIDSTKISEQDWQNHNYRTIINQSLKNLKPELSSLEDLNSLYLMVSKISNLELKNQISRNKKQIYWLTASSAVDMFIKYNQDENLTPLQSDLIKKLQTANQIKIFFNWDFFKFGDSRSPEIAGIKTSFVGSVLVMLIFLIFAFPIGVMCAFYLEEFAKKNRLTDIIEISINNLAGIPSIIYGLLGLTLYLQIMHLPRSSSLVGGLTLFMLVLPVIIIATRNTIRTIPNTIRDGALAIGASKMQLIWHHLLPLSIPGIMTGTILAISRAIGETAPLLMIGMVAFIADVPQGFFDPSSALAVQIYLWSDLPESGFVEKTSGAILSLLVFLILLNYTAIILRKKFERKW